MHDYWHTVYVSSALIYSKPLSSTKNCAIRSMTLYSSPRLSLPPVSLIVFIDVGILTLSLQPHAQAHIDFQTRLCVDTGRVRTSVGLGPRFTFTIRGGVTGNLLVRLYVMCRCRDWESLFTDITRLTNSNYWGIALAYFFYILQAVAKGGVEVDVIFEYVIKCSGKLSLHFSCVAGSPTTQACVSADSGWPDNRINLYAWYQRRTFSFGLKWGPRNHWEPFSRSWKLPSSQ